jgi:calcineurin-like phosphoesterase family protein
LASGDFAVRASSEVVARCLERLHGRKHLVIGNNDQGATVSQSGWRSTQHYAEMELDGTRLVLCHYPFRTWNGMYKGAYNIHGHSHGKLSKMTRQIDVGVDVWDFRPITLDHLRRRKPSAD